MEFDENLAAIHAYLCADGYVIKNPETQKHVYYHIGLRNTNNTLLEDFQKRFEERFGLEPHITNEGRCRIQNKEIYKFLTKDFSYYSNEWQLPKLSKHNLRIWLRAFFDCEGWVSIEKAKNRRIGLDSINKKGIFEVQKELLRFDIPSKIESREKRKIFRLNIYGKENLIKFQKEIGFLHPTKKQKLEEAIKSYINLYWEFPKTDQDIKNLIIKLFKDRFSKKRLHITSVKIENITKLKKYLKNLFNIESRIYNHTRYFELEIPKKDRDKLKV